MHTSGFTHTSVSKYLVGQVVLAAVLASLTDSKYFFHIALQPHLFPYRQWWRLLVWQTAYANSTEVLFAVMMLYQCRVVERAWGSRKFVVCLLYHMRNELLPTTTVSCNLTTTMIWISCR